MALRLETNIHIITQNSLASPGTYMGGSSEMLSPTVTAQQPITPSDGQKKIHFEFPPDLVAPTGYQQQPMTSPRPPIHPCDGHVEVNENQAHMLVPVHMEPYQAIPPAQHNQSIIPQNSTFTQKPMKTDILTLGTGSTRSIRSSAESSVSSTTINKRIPFSQLNSSLNNSSLSSDLHPKRAQYKQMRKQARVVATAGGMVVGGLTLGPAGIMVGAGVGMATNQYYKRKDKKAQQRHEQRSFQQGANESIVARHQGAYC